ncbi:MAG: hypothetical protein QOH31_1495 [Verrucomicrobiota bacterium]|jgi:hypothetical protein
MRRMEAYAKLEDTFAFLDLAICTVGDFLIF